MDFVDAHSHLHLIKGIAPAIERAKKQGVKAILACGYAYEENRKILELARQFPIVKPVIGLDPQAALRPFDIQRELRLLEEHKHEIKGVGEIGLDFKYAKTGEQKEKQRYCFGQMLDFALRENLPVVVHTRDAEPEVVELLAEKGLRSVLLHCFSGTVETAAEGLERGYYFSMPPVPSASRERVIKHIPLDNLMLETDAPFMGREPADVVKSAELVARIKSVRIEEVASKTTENCIKLFKLRD